MLNKIRTIILAGVIGDYLGVQCEFVPRHELFGKNLQQILSDYHTHGVELGAWSDDTSLTLCTMESLAEKGYNPVDISNRFVRWYNEGYMTATGEVFDVGGTTMWAIKKLMSGMMYHDSGIDDLYANGNGGLMRIMPVILYSLNDTNLVDRVSEVTAITHKHYISIWSSVYFALYVKYSLQTEDKLLVLQATNNEFIRLLTPLKERNALLSVFNTLLEPFTFIDKDLHSLDTTGYVYGTLETVIWLDYFYRDMPYDNFIETVLRLGGDTDTVGSIASQLWGIHHTLDEIPGVWLSMMKSKHLVDNVISKFLHKLKKEGKLLRS